MGWDAYDSYAIKWHIHGTYNYTKDSFSLRKAHLEIKLTCIVQIKCDTALITILYCITYAILKGQK